MFASIFSSRFTSVFSSTLLSSCLTSSIFLSSIKVSTLSNNTTGLFSSTILVWTVVTIFGSSFFSLDSNLLSFILISVLFSVSTLLVVGALELPSLFPSLFISTSFSLSFKLFATFSIFSSLSLFSSFVSSILLVVTFFLSLFIGGFLPTTGFVTTSFPLVVDGRWTLSGTTFLSLAGSGFALFVLLFFTWTVLLRLFSSFFPFGGATLLISLFFSSTFGSLVWDLDLTSSFFTGVFLVSFIPIGFFGCEVAEGSKLFLSFLPTTTEPLAPFTGAFVSLTSSSEGFSTGFGFAASSRSKRNLSTNIRIKY